MAPGLVMVDMVQFQDVVNVINPNGLVVPGCDPGSSLFGVCFTIQNPTGSTVTSAMASVSPWQCYNSTVILDFVDPVTGQFEGAHCLSTSLLIPCGSADVALTLPPGGLLPGQQTLVQYDFEGSALFGCFGSSFVGVDVTFREPTPGDPAAGIRSAKDGPLVEISPGVFSLFQGIFPVDDPATKTNGAGRRIKNFLIDARF